MALKARVYLITCHCLYQELPRPWSSDINERLLPSPDQIAKQPLLSLSRDVQYS